MRGALRGALQNELHALWDGTSLIMLLGSVIGLLGCTRNPQRNVHADDDMCGLLAIPKVMMGKLYMVKGWILSDGLSGS